MGLIRTQSGLLGEDPIKRCYSTTIGASSSNYAKLRKLCGELIAFFDKIEFSTWKGKWQDRINDLYKANGINREYVDDYGRFSLKEECEEWDFKKMKWEVFVERMSREMPTDLDIIYLYEACIQGDLEWACLLSLNEHRTVGEILKENYNSFRNLQSMNEKYEEYFEKKFTYLK